MTYKVSDAYYCRPFLQHIERAQDCDLHQKVWDQICADSVQTSSYSQTFFPSAVRLWNIGYYTIVEICRLPPGHFKSHLNSKFIRFSWCAHSAVFLSHTALYCFYPNDTASVVYCMASLARICLLTPDAILLVIESRHLHAEEDW